MVHSTSGNNQSAFVELYGWRMPSYCEFMTLWCYRLSQICILKVSLSGTDYELLIYQSKMAWLKILCASQGLADVFDCSAPVLHNRGCMRRHHFTFLPIKVNSCGLHWMMIPFDIQTMTAKTPGALWLLLSECQWKMCRFQIMLLDFCCRGCKVMIICTISVMQFDSSFMCLHKMVVFFLPFDCVPCI